MPRRIPTHRTTPDLAPISQREYDRTRRDTESKRFYNSAVWRKTRALKLAQDPLCEVCRQAKRLIPASHVHHKVELRDDRDLGLDLDNLQSLCHPCHSRHHARA